MVQGRLRAKIGEWVAKITSKQNIRTLLVFILSAAKYSSSKITLNHRAHILANVLATARFRYYHSITDWVKLNDFKEKL